MIKLTFNRTVTTAFVSAAFVMCAAPAAATTPVADAKKTAILTCKTTTPEGLSYTIIKAGQGEMPGADAKVTVTYKGFLASDGSEFDAGEDVQFPVGGVISGFSQGLKLMQPGSKYRLCIPARLGYGEAGSGPIPANADLVFEVELLSFTTPPPKPIIPLAERACDKTTSTGLGYLLIKPGTGRMPNDADMALVDFTTFEANTGVVLEERQWEKIPLAQATALFGEALKSMKMGSSYTFCMPAESPTQIGAAQEGRINIRIDLLDIRAAPAAE